MRRGFSLTLVLAALALPALAQPLLLDDRGVALRLTAPPQRIVSLLPSLTESVCALGACGRLVGIDNFSDWPASVRALPRLGGLEDVQIERIVALRPDLVLAAKSTRASQRLEALGLKVMALDSDTHADVHRSLRLLSQLLGVPEAGGRVWAGIEASLAAAAARVPPALRGRTVYFEVGAGPYAAGAGSFIGETLARLGLVNAVPASLGPFPLLNPEFVVRTRPDFIMASARDIAAMPSRPGWQALPALRGRSCGFDAPSYELLLRPGPRLGEAAGLLADCLAGVAP